MKKIILFALPVLVILTAIILSSFTEDNSRLQTVYTVCSAAAMLMFIGMLVWAITNTIKDIRNK